ncbi:cephalosporin hydroxylase family protein [Planktomarina temperata]|nr:cephalosporin hydroxylase family protein [Planktomarina temperata]
MKFNSVVRDNIKALVDNVSFKKSSTDWVIEASRHNYPYNFSWLGRPAIQYPADMIAMQEIIWRQKPSVIVEAGIAHGGSVIFSASMLALLEIEEAARNSTPFDLINPRRKVIAIDIDIRDHNRAAIEAHPFAPWISLIEGSSIERDTIQKVNDLVGDEKNVLVSLDSNHTHDHVLGELKAYSRFVPIEGYCCVFDTVIEDMPSELLDDKPWGQGNNPKTAVWEFLRTNKHFQIDKDIEAKIQTTVAPDGFLKRIK